MLKYFKNLQAPTISAFGATNAPGGPSVVERVVPMSSMLALVSCSLCVKGNLDSLWSTAFTSLYINDFIFTVQI